MDVGIILLYAALGLVSTVASQCVDMDTQACILLEQSNPDLCKDPSLSSTACPRHCNMCPLSCYHCEGAITEFKTQCNTTHQCDAGQQCMLRHLKSTSDGHHEYVAACVSVDMCDVGLAIPFGRRRSNLRNVEVTCCNTDLCNSPITPATTTTKATTTRAAPTTTTSLPVITTTKSSVCMRDILIFVEDATYNGDQGLKDFLIGVVSELQIGTHANLVELSTIDWAVHTKWDLGQYTDRHSLSNAIHLLQLNHLTNQVDLDDLVNYIEQTAFSTRNGDRPNVPNDIVIIVSNHGVVHSHVSSFQQHLVESHSGNIIVINVDWWGGDGDAMSVLSHLATDAHHVLSVNGYGNLGFIKNRVVSLLCK